MAVRKIITLPHPLLRKRSTVVDPANADTGRLIRDLCNTLEAKENPRGVGLSAVQIGVLARVIVIRDPNKELVPLINPEIIWRSNKGFWKPSKRKNPLEGCLSIPGIWGQVKRDPYIKVAYQNREGKTITKSFRNFPAIVVQHEIDHCDGILFIDRVIEQKGKLYQSIINKEGQETLVEITEIPKFSQK